MRWKNDDTRHIRVFIKWNVVFDGNSLCNVFN